jgi:hypothetical protein
MEGSRFPQRLRRERTWRRAAGALAVLAGAIAVSAPAALANLPSQHDKRVVPFKSIGGVRIGDSFAAARGAWGKPSGPSHCDGTSSCTYEAKNGEAVFDVGTHGVFDVYIEINLNTVHPSWKTPLTAFHTSKGIHLGSTLAQIKAAYPGGGAVNTGGYYGVKGPHRTELFFFIDQGRAGSIGIDSQNT